MENGVSRFSPSPLVATPPIGVRQVELMRGEGRVGRVEVAAGGVLETEGEAMGAHMELMTDTFAERDGGTTTGWGEEWEVVEEEEEEDEVKEMCS